MVVSSAAHLALFSVASSSPRSTRMKAAPTSGSTMRPERMPKPNISGSLCPERGPRPHPHDEEARGAVSNHEGSRIGGRGTASWFETRLRRSSP